MPDIDELKDLCEKANRRRLELSDKPGITSDAASFHDGYAAGMYDVLEYFKGKPGNLKFVAGVKEDA